MPSWLPDLKTSVESLEKVCASRADFSRWVISAFEQRQETVKLVCHACLPGKEDSASEFAYGFKAYAYCQKHLTLDGKKCPVRWRVEGRAGMMHIEQNAEGAGDFPEEKVAHGPLPRMVRGVSAGQRTQLKAISAGGAETPLLNAPADALDLDSEDECAELFGSTQEQYHGPTQEPAGGLAVVSRRR